MVAAPLESDRPLTYEDLAGFPDDGHRYELLQGELIVSPAPDGTHQIILNRLNIALVAAVKEARYGTVLIAPFDIRFSRSNVVEPDLFAFSTNQYAQYKGSHFEGAPEFVVEVLSPGSVRYDRVRKADLYMEHGVKEYWIVEPPGKRILVHIAESSEPQPRIVANGALTSVMIPTFTVDLEELFLPDLETFG
jgi:Uma2 family endonuclease